MTLSNMEIKCIPELYVWYRYFKTSWRKEVLNGEVMLEIYGAEEEGYWGQIRVMADDYDRFEPIFSTKPKEEDALHVPFRTPENCAVHLEAAWKDIIKKESEKL